MFYERLDVYERLDDFYERLGCLYERLDVFMRD